jgi:hypothetical protein
VVIKKNIYLLPYIDDMLDKIKEMKYYILIDLAAGY